METAEAVLIRKAAEADMPALLHIYAAARAFMRSHNNPDQWGDSDPKEETLREDIRLGQLYVMETEGSVHAAFAFIPGVDPTYAVIHGAWKDASAYAAVHRVASDGTLHGVVSRCMAFCRRTCGHLRVDTHADNFPMQGALLREGFAFCGVIRLEDGKPRWAYEWSAQ